MWVWGGRDRGKGDTIRLAAGSPSANNVMLSTASTAAFKDSNAPNRHPLLQPLLPPACFSLLSFFLFCSFFGPCAIKRAGGRSLLASLVCLILFFFPPFPLWTRKEVNCVCGGLKREVVCPPLSVMARTQQQKNGMCVGLNQIDPHTYAPMNK